MGAYLLLLATICISYVLYRSLAFVLRRYLVEKFTAVNDLQKLDQPRPYRKVRGAAVVCGGSISGLLAAKACAAHFESVIVIEAEEWLTDRTATDVLEKSYRDADFPHKRSHVAQYQATHFFLPFLVNAMLKWFPNFASELEKRGAKIVPQDAQMHVSGVPLARPELPTTEKPLTMTITRPNFEALLRKLVLESCPNIEYISGSVSGLVRDPNVNDIKGVRVRKSTGETIVPASLVLDCTGSAMGGFRWLKELAISEAHNISASQLDSLRSTYSPKLRYATFEFDVPSHLRPRMKELGYPGNWETTFVDFMNHADPNVDSTAFAVLKEEHSYLQYVCGGCDRPKNSLITIDDMREFIAQIPVSRPFPEWVTLVLDLFEENQVPFTAVSHSLASCIYTPYHLYVDLPSNFVVIGDAGMMTNPLRAIGCTKACVEVVTLNNLLFHYNPDKDKNRIDKLPVDFSQRFGKIAARRTANFWETYKVDDYSFATTIPCKGEDHSYGKGSRALSNLFVKLMENDTESVSKVMLVRGFLIPYTDMFTPSMLIKLGWVKIRDVLGINRKTA